MSGDVQPRKRKDKRRKKEEESLGSIQDLGESKDEKEKPAAHSHGSSDKGENIHVHHDHGIGGGIIVKIIFFALLALLLGLVGLIFIESRGSTDVDLPSIEDSRFAEYFTGWLDDSPDDHGHDDHAVGSEEGDDDHGDEDDEHGDAHSEEAEEEDEGHSEQEDSEHAATEEQEDDEDSRRVESEEKDEPDDDDQDEDEDEESENTAEEELDDDENESRGDDGNSDEVEDEDDENSEQVEEDNDKDEDEAEEEEEVEEEEEEDEEEKDEDEEDYDLTQEDSQEDKSETPVRKITKETEEKLEDDDDDSGIEDNDEPESDQDEQEISAEEEEEEDNEEEADQSEEEPKESFFDQSEEVEEIEESEEALKEEEEAIKKEKLSLMEDDEEIEDISDVKLRRKKEKELMRKLEKLLKEQANPEVENDEDQEREENEETSGVALKLGVGVALVVVAHLVVVRRWRQLTHANGEPRELPDTETEKTVEPEVEPETEPVVSRRQTLIPETADIPADEFEDEEGEEYSDEEVIEQPVKRRTSMDIKREREDPEKYYTKEELGDSEDLDDEEELVEEEEYLEEEELLEEEEELVEEEEDDYELEASPPASDLGEPEEEGEEEEEEEEEPEPQRPIPPPRRGPQGLETEDILENDNEPILRDEPQDLDDGDSLEANKDSAEPKAAEEDDDWFFRQELDFADAQFQNKPQQALDTYEKILKKSANLVRALVGRARALDRLADVERSNLILGKAIEAYFTLITDHASRLDDDTFREIAERCVNRMRFAGRNVNAAVVHQALIDRFPDEIQHRNAMAVSYLLGGRTKLAQHVLEATLARWPDDGFAQVHLGFVLKTSSGLLEEGVELLEKGIRSNQSGTMDGRFLFHLGDALHRLGRGDEAMQWYELGVRNNIFKSKYQRSLYNVDRLEAKPWWSLESTTYQEFFWNLEKHWEKIREEGMSLLRARDKSLFQDEAESLKDTGDWKQLDLYSRGRKQPGCSRAPFTCQLIGAFQPAATCSRGQAKFSVMEPGTHVWPHCGPTNCRLRAHLGLVVPDGVYLRVAEETKSWKNGKVFVFDDSFEHEVWHNGTSVRLVLIIDVWHPELTLKERQTLSPI